ncbi:uncharacterized protein [Rutidosis leptorrhynchoides]|uniref:uncharacterized protein n=1 Tax=Rutidosis leptorrhynchoides TaxID=125765 RepID=UPI003A9A055A
MVMRQTKYPYLNSRRWSSTIHLTPCAPGMKLTHFCRWYGLTCGRRHERVTALDLRSMKLTGLNLTAHRNMSFLKRISLQNNSFFSHIPPEIGIIPLSISNASNLKKFQVYQNEFTGQVPSFENSHKLWKVLIEKNHLGSGGAVDDLNFLYSLANATNLEYLQLTSNNFGGPLPWCFSKLTTSLRVWTMQKNQISGNIPTWIGNLTSLEVLAMSNNPFSGEIPFSIGILKKLYVLSISNTNIQGNIPPSIGNLSELNYLILSSNNLQGSIPQSLTNFRMLRQFELSHNNLNGSIPSGLLNSTSLTSYFNISINRLTGTIPVEVGNLNLGVLDVSANMLSGEIPSTLGGFMSLETLHINSNSFHGKIPSSLRSLRGLQDIDFSSNNLSGEIPDFLSSFELHYLNLSNNNFEGNVPIKGIFTNASATSVMGNSKLCGERKEANTLPKIQGHSFQKVSYKNIIEATRGLSSTNLVGVGSFGSVYKGSIMKFIVECEALRNIRHRNLVKVVTACSVVVHSDLKPSNVLLDEDMTGHVGLQKVFIFCVEYGIGNEVSIYGEVYSYGILLLELFTRKRPTIEMFKEGLSLHSYVLTALPKKVAQISDPIIVQEISNDSNMSEALESIISIFRVGIGCSVELASARMNMVDVVAELCSIRNKLCARQQSQPRQARTTT